jgi:hypothetical protein
MNAFKLMAPAVAPAIVLTAAALVSGTATAQNARAQDSGASMVKPPAQASGGSDNPDNMPVKKPRKPTNDKMMHDPPASAANAK